MVPALDVSASYDVEQQQGALFLVNRHQKEAVVTDLIWQNGKTVQVEKVWQLAGSDPKETNSWEEPNRLVIKAISAPNAKDDQVTVQLPPLSFTAITFRTT